MTLRIQVVSLLLRSESEGVSHIPVVAWAIVSALISDDEKICGLGSGNCRAAR